MSSLGNPNPVSLKLERLLQERGVTHAELARRLGVSRPAVSRLLNPNYDGHSVPSLRRIAEALGVQLEVTFSEPNERSRPGKHY